ncbi:MAG: RsmE family RNA methyltransferase [Chitinispirillaceae bacterium]
MRKTEHHLFYSQEITDDTVILDQTETRHAVSVLRLKEGQKLQVTDGRGNIYECRYDRSDNRKALCSIRERHSVPGTSPEVTLLVGLPDKDAFETVLEHATALGVYRIVPLEMEHCRKPWWKRWEKFQERFFQKMIVSMKQCLYPYLPLLENPQTLEAVVRSSCEQIVAADQDGEVLERDVISEERIAGLVGPPGGYSDKEREVLEDREVRRVRISHHRLRTELAATVLGGVLTFSPHPGSRNSTPTT